MREIKYLPNINRFQANYNGKSLGIYKTEDDANKAIDQASVLNKDFDNLLIYKKGEIIHETI